jgi:hypothetical protein
MIKRLMACARRFNEYRKVRANLLLADEVPENLRAQARVAVFIAVLGAYEARRSC